MNKVHICHNSFFKPGFIVIHLHLGINTINILLPSQRIRPVLILGCPNEFVMFPKNDIYIYWILLFTPNS